MGGGSGFSQGHQTSASPQQSNYYNEAQSVMPQQFFGNKPIEDPTSILSAYAKNMPSFLLMSQPNAVPSTPNSALQSPLSELQAQLAKLEAYQQNQPHAAGMTGVTPF